LHSQLQRQTSRTLTSSELSHLQNLSETVKPSPRNYYSEVRVKMSRTFLY